MIDDRNNLRADPGSKTSPEVLEMRGQIEDTRGALIDKLETLEDRVMGSVENSVQAVKETVHTVKRNLDIKFQVDQHPWLMVAGSVLTGYVLGQIGNRRGHTGTTQTSMSSLPSPAYTRQRETPAVESPLSQLKNRFMSQLQEGLGELERTAVSTITTLVQQWLQHAVTRMSPEQDHGHDGEHGSGSMPRYS